MKLKLFAMALAFFLSIGAGWADANPSQQVFDQLKALKGTWTGASPEGPMTVEYDVIANGSAVMETMFKGTPAQMVSMYYLDGGNLVMVHYCAAGNQPRMKLDPKSTPTEWTFLFDGGANISPDKGTYMTGGSAVLEGDTLTWHGQAMQDGKSVDCGTVKLTRTSR